MNLCLYRRTSAASLDFECGAICTYSIQASPILVVKLGSYTDYMQYPRTIKNLLLTTIASPYAYTQMENN